MATHVPANAGYIAANRFGMGLRPGELNKINSDPKGWLRAQLATLNKVPALYDAIPDSRFLLAREGEQRSARRERNRADVDEQAQRSAERAYQRETAEERQRQLQLRTQVAIETDAPFAERLVRFWSNHLTVAIAGGAKAVLRTISVPYENEAIRANLAGDFYHLLLAVEQHPAMLIYLDNNASIGPRSAVGRRRSAGLNENLAREILELHTLGVNGGYDQADVSSLARMLTGWTVPMQDAGARVFGASEPGQFHFIQAMHEPGVQQLLGKSYPDHGREQGELALADLAAHPATARHIAMKMARHFVADEPPPEAVLHLERVFLDTQGDLPSLHGALIDLEAAWDSAQRKLKTPEELVVSSARALDVHAALPGGEQAVRGFAGTLALLNHAPFSATSPAGWPDSADHWGSPDALLKRIEWANEIAERSGGRLDAARLYPQVLPTEEGLAQAIARAESSSQALSLLLGSPQFQWR